jgi:hypothetical protein
MHTRTHPRRDIHRLDSRHCFSTVENRSRRPTTTNMRASLGVTGYPRSASSLPRRSIAPRHSGRLWQASGTAPPPFLDSRKSVTSTIEEIRRWIHCDLTGSPRRRSCETPASDPRSPNALRRGSSAGAATLASTVPPPRPAAAAAAQRACRRPSPPAGRRWGPAGQKQPEYQHGDCGGLAPMPPGAC